jgi:hypothetical protein
MHPVGRRRNIINSNFCKSYISGIFLVLFSAFALHNSLLPSYHNIELLLMQELLERLGIQKLNERLNDPNMQGFFESIFPKDHPKNMRFAIKFFMAHGLGVITERLLEKMMPLTIE